MAKTILVPYDFKQNEIRNAVVQNLASAPGSPVKGQLYYDTVANKLYWWNNTAWVDATGAAGAILASLLTTKGDIVVATASATAARQGIGADGTLLVANSGVANGLNWRALLDTDIPGTLARTSAIVPISTVTTKGDLIVATASGAVARQAAGANNTFLVADSSQTNGVKYRALLNADVAELIATNDLSDWPRVAALDLGSQKITGLANGTATTDAATFGQLNAILEGKIGKDPVEVASTANLGLTGLTAIDGYTPVAGDRVLAKNQTTASQNGVYVAAAGAWTRAADMDAAAEFKNATVLVLNGTVGQGKIFTESATVTTVGTDTVTFVQTGNANTLYTADSTTITLTGSQFSITPLGVGTASLAAQAVTAAKLGAVAGNGLTGGAGSALAVNPGAGIIADGTSTRVDPAVVVEKFAANVGDGSSTSIVITHNLGTRDVQVQLYTNGTPWDTVECDVQRTSTTTATLLFSVAPASNAYRVVVQG